MSALFSPIRTRFGKSSSRGLLPVGTVEGSNSHPEGFAGGAGLEAVAGQTYRMKIESRSAYRPSAWLRRWTLSLVACVPVAFAGLYPSLAAADPTPCGEIRQITDARGDGHHVNTDVIAAWFDQTEEGISAVIEPRLANWGPEHDDSDEAGFAFRFSQDGVTRVVRARAWRSLPLSYDFGRWSPLSGFQSEGSTTGSPTAGVGGRVRIVLPEEFEFVNGDILTDTFVLTYDGIENGTPHWVDRAPGGTEPADPLFGADFVVGSCGIEVIDPVTSAVTLAVPSTRRGSGKVEVVGSVRPARAGVDLELTVSSAGGSRTLSVQSGADGTFGNSLGITETTTVRARALDSGVQSAAFRVLMRSVVTLRVRNLAGGRAVVSGSTSPGLPGRILLLRPYEIRPTARTVARNGKFSLRLGRSVRGSFRALYIPFKGRAERALSNRGAIK
ncbi:MAG: hypothetical protein ACKOBH_06855 [bacterium]